MSAGEEQVPALAAEEPASKASALALPKRSTKECPSDAERLMGPLVLQGTKNYIASSKEWLSSVGSSVDELVLFVVRCLSMSHRGKTALDGLHDNIMQDRNLKKLVRPYPLPNIREFIEGGGVEGAMYAALMQFEQRGIALKSQLSVIQNRPAWNAIDELDLSFELMAFLDNHLGQFEVHGTDQRTVAGGLTSAYFNWIRSSFFIAIARHDHLDAFAPVPLRSRLHCTGGDEEADERGVVLEDEGNSAAGDEYALDEWLVDESDGEYSPSSESDSSSESSSLEERPSLKKKKKRKHGRKGKGSEKAPKEIPPVKQSDGENEDAGAAKPSKKKPSAGKEKLKRPRLVDPFEDQVDAVLGFPHDKALCESSMSATPLDI